MESGNMWYFMSEFLKSAKRFQSSTVLQHQQFIPFCGRVMFFGMDTPHFVILSTHELMKGLPSPLWLSCGQVFVGMLCFQSFFQGVELLGRMRIPCLTRATDCHIVFFRSCNVLHLRCTFCTSTAMQEGSEFSTPLPTLIFLFKNSSHPGGCEVVSHGGFDLHFP